MFHGFIKNKNISFACFTSLLQDIILFMVNYLKGLRNSWTSVVGEEDPFVSCF